MLEDESRAVGSCALPLPLYQRMQQVPMVWLEDSLEHRVERILQDYVIDLCAEFVAVHGDEGFSLFSERLLASLDNIHKRLGGDRHRRLMNILETALAEQANSGAVDLHRGWIEGLLREYYDPMYVFQREKEGAADRVLGGAGGGAGISAGACAPGRVTTGLISTVNPCGTGLARDSGVSVTSISMGLTLSRASSLPQRELATDQVGQASLPLSKPCL
nr:hypothetical protein GCM10020185_03140 [Pseudomonas brassicacearum subsp. brassicacearum]